MRSARAAAGTWAWAIPTPYARGRLGYQTDCQSGAWRSARLSQCNGDMASPVSIGVGAPSADDVVAVARHDAPVTLAEEAVGAIKSARAAVEELAAAPTP